MINRLVILFGAVMFLASCATRQDAPGDWCHRVLASRRAKKQNLLLILR